MYGSFLKSFIIRVQLGDRPPADYDDLHEALAQYECERSITVEGVSYKLPFGEYFLQSSKNATEIAEEVNTIASKVSQGKAPLVLVLEVANWGFKLNKE